jgi:hypothetical protein
MRKVMTEDIVNEICKVCIEALGGKFNKFVVAVGIRGVEDGEKGFYSYGETILISELDFSREALRLFADINCFVDTFKSIYEDDTGLVFVVENDTIEMHLCSDSCGSFQPELTFTFKKTFDDDLFD